MASHQNKIVYGLKSPEKSVQFKSNTLWYNLQADLKSLETLKIFKRKYKQHLISNQWNLVTCHVFELHLGSDFQPSHF